MASHPPDDTDDDRGWQGSEPPAAVLLDEDLTIEVEDDDEQAELLTAADETSDQLILDRAAAHDPEAQVAYFEAEAAAAAGNPRRASPLVHQVGRLRARAPNGEREAARSFASSLTLDPSFQPNAWALRRIFLVRRLWDNLVRVLDAELRFASWSRATDRADVYVERGRLLEDHLGRAADAQASYQAALELVPDHAGALWAALLEAARSPDPAPLEAALLALARRASSPALKAAATVELARLARGVLLARIDPETATRASEALMRGLSAGADPGVVLRELDRLSLASDRGDLRLKYLDAFDSRIARPTLAALEASGGVPGAHPLLAQVAGLTREKARILFRRGQRDAALSVLERALQIAPRHPLVLQDLLDAAEETGYAHAFGSLLDNPAMNLPPDFAAEAHLRRAELAARTGALGEAAGALAQVAGDAPSEALSALVNLRVLARLQDADGLARAFTEAASRVGFEEPAEAAHLLTRAGALRLALEDPSAAETLFREALSRAPGYPPAGAGLAGVLARTGRYEELAQTLEREARALGEGARREQLGRALVTLYRDLLGAPERALPHVSARPMAELDDRSLLGVVDVAGWAAERQGGTAAESTLLAGLAELVARAQGPTVAAALRTLAARAAARAGRSDEAARLLSEAFAADAGSAAAAELERAAASEGRHEARRDIVARELEAAKAAGREASARALRFRLAFLAANQGRFQDAIEQLAPLRHAQDRLAAAWSLDLARRASDARAEVALLGEPALTAPADGSEVTAPGERAWALAEALERLGDRAGAAAAYRDAGTDGDEPLRAVDASLALLRTAASAGDATALVGALRRLGAVLDGEGGPVRAEADLVALAAGLPLETEAAPGVPAWLAGVRSADPRQVSTGLATMAEMAEASAPAAANDLRAAVAIRRRLLGDPEALVALADAARTGAAHAAVLVAATDLPLPPPEARPALRELRRTRAVDLGRDPERRPIAEALWLDEAFEAELAGRLDAAARAHGEVLALRPDSLEAVEGLRRVARAAGARRFEAAALVRRGELCRAPRRTAEAFAEAALLFEEQGDPDQAAALFRRVLALVPSDDEAYQRLRALLERKADAPALETLLSFKLGQIDDPNGRVRLLVERARLRLDRLEDRTGAIADFKRVLEIEPDHPESLRTLGQLALDAGRNDAAARWLERALSRQSDPVAGSTLGLLLSQAREAQGDLAGAAAALREAIAARPEDTEARERLIALSLSERDLGPAVAELRALAAIAATPFDKASVLVRIGRIERDRRSNPQAAFAAFREALVLDPSGEAATELGTVLPALHDLPAAELAPIDDVIAGLRRALSEGDPLDGRALERLRELAALRGRAALAGVAGQLLAVLGLGGARGRARDLARPLGLATLNVLMRKGDAPVGGIVFEVWEHLADAAARTLGPEPAAVGVGRSTRLIPGTEPRLAWVEAAALAVGLGAVTIHVGGPDELAVIALDVPEPLLLVGRGILGGDLESRFRVGRALFLLRQRATLLERCAPAELDRLFAAAAVAIGARSAPPEAAELKADARALSRSLTRRDLRSLEAYQPRVASEQLDAVGWRAAVLRGADRFGLLVAGDLGSCLRALCAGDPAGVAGRAPTDPRCVELIRFAFDDRYAAARREAGLGGTAGEG